MYWWVWPTVVVAGLIVIAAFWLAETADRHDQVGARPEDGLPPVR